MSKELEYLKRFSAAVSDKYVKAGVWARDGYAYATNGHIAARIPLEKLSSTESIDFDASDRPPLTQVYKPFNAPTVSVRADDFPLTHDELKALTPQKCLYCKGTNVVPTTRCEDCNGTGERLCDMGHYHDCHSCCGQGKFYVEASDPSKTVMDICPECSGKGVTFNSSGNIRRSIQVHSAQFAPKYWHIIADGIREFANGEALMKEDPKYAYAFSFTLGDFEVVAMGMNI